MYRMSAFIFVVFCVILSVNPTNAAECCRAYTDPMGNSKPAQFCSSYCCFKFLEYTCCDNEILHQAALVTGQVDDCRSWIETHVWVAVLIGIAGLAIVITLATCCCCCCCGACGTCFGCCERQKPGTVIISPPPPPQPQVMVMHSEMRTPLTYGYDQ